MIARRVCLIAGLVLLTALPLVLVVGCLLLNSAPVASFTFHLSQSVSPCTVALDASASHDPDGIIAKYEWSFGDGATGTDRSTSHVYTTSGTLTITLVVTDDKGKTATASQTITVLLPYVPPPDLPPPTPPPSGLLRFVGHDSPQDAPPSFPWAETFYMEYVGVSEVGGGRKFSVVLLDALHRRVAQLADEYGDFEGRRDLSCECGYEGPFFLDIVAVGDWAITVFTSTEAAAPPQTYAGCGSTQLARQLSQYSPLFSLATGRATFYFGGVDMVLMDYFRKTEAPLSHEVDVLGAPTS
ncbi:MAG: PKD domain-containing protein [Candidatus Bipolaricaulota bacterium]|nr:PKD domain-containing protein [Candidatus Bipolaricaulota bacterium]